MCPFWVSVITFLSQNNNFRRPVCKIHSIQSGQQVLICNDKCRFEIYNRTNLIEVAKAGLSSKKYKFKLLEKNRSSCSSFLFSSVEIVEHKFWAQTLFRGEKNYRFVTSIRFSRTCDYNICMSIALCNHA